MPCSRHQFVNGEARQDLRQVLCSIGKSSQRPYQADRSGRGRGEGRVRSAAGTMGESQGQSPVDLADQAMHQPWLTDTIWPGCWTFSCEKGGYTSWEFASGHAASEAFFP